MGHLPLGRLYVVINDGYLAQVPEGAGAHLHNTDRYNTVLQDQDRTGLQQTGEWQTSAMHVAALPPTPVTYNYFCQMVTKLFFFNQLEGKHCRLPDVFATPPLPSHAPFPLSFRIFQTDASRASDERGRGSAG